MPVRTDVSSLDDVGRAWTQGVQSERPVLLASHRLPSMDRVMDREMHMAVGEGQAKRLRQRIEAEWGALQESYAGLSDARLTEPGVAGDWSVKDILAHVTTWEEEALKHLPIIIEGGRPPRYVTYGGIDAFNARMTEQKRALPVADVLTQLNETHGRMLAFIGSISEDQLRARSRCRRRLRLDTYGHYPQHAEAIREWRSGEEWGRAGTQPPEPVRGREEDRNGNQR